MKPGKISGSRYDDGNVPNVNWNDSKMNVNWYNSDNCNDNLRARAEVSKKRDPNYFGISLIFSKLFKYFIQPLVILEISCKSDSRSRHFLFWEKTTGENAH